ncbi:retrovirus-related pol polyprotein from transposon TNT 1-94 [Tanacetum coccineum]
MSNVSHQQYYSQSSTTPPSTYVPPHFADNSQLDSGLSIMNNLIEDLTYTIDLLTLIYKTYLPQTNNKLRSSSIHRNQASVQGRLFVVQNVQGRQNKGQGNNARGAGVAGYGGLRTELGMLIQVKQGRLSRQDNAIDEDVDEQPVQDLALNVDNVFQADDCDAFDSDVDAVCEHHEEHEMHDDVQPNYVVDSHANYTSDSNMIPYDQNLKKELHSVKMQLASTINHNKSMVEEVTSLKKDFKQKENKYLEEFLDMKALKEKVEDKLYKQDQNKVKIAPPDYSKENYLATFTPQKQLTPEQIFWSQDLIKMKEEALKKQTTASRPIKALMVYPPNTPATLVPRVLPTKSQVKINIFTLIQLFSEFEKTCKKRITPTGLTEGERGFEQTKECYLTEVIPFFKTLKEHFEGIQKALTKEIKEMKDIFEELEAEVDQNVVNRKHDEIERKNLLIANDNLIVDCLSKEVFYIATNSELTVSRFTEMHEAHTIVQTRCLELKAELSKLRDKVQKIDNTDLVKTASPSIHNIHNVMRKVKQVWKPKQVRQVWKPTSKVLTSVGHQWRPTGRIFTLGEQCPLTRLTAPKVVSAKQNEYQAITVLTSRNPTKIGDPTFQTLHLRYGDYMIGDSVISRVYYVEGPGHNLVFMAHNLCSRGSNLYTILAEDMMKSSLICLLSKASKNKSWLWYRRLNHLNFGTINDLARKDLVRGLPRLKFEKDHLCSACQLGKSKKHTHKPKPENTNLEVLNTVHMDLCGPMRVQIINGKKYILIMVDDYSREILSIRFLTDYYERVGIFHQKTIPRTPQQNGIVEIRNRTIVEAARTMLIFSKALMFLWAEAMATACYTAPNRSLIHTRHDKTPYELVHDKKPGLTFFCVFGALCYPTNDSEDLVKLQPTADIGIFVGYASSRKGYRIYNKRT